MSRSNIEPCQNCEVLKLQLELKESVIKTKDEKISLLSDSLIQTQRELIAAKEEALREYRKLQQLNSNLGAANTSQKSKINGNPNGHKNTNINNFNDLLSSSSAFDRQNNLLEKEQYSVEPSNSSDADWVSGSNEILFRENRAYIGHVTEDITRAKLRRSLEDKFGQSYERAIEEGSLFIDGNDLGIEEPRKRNNEGEIASRDYPSANINLSPSINPNSNLGQATSDVRSDPRKPTQERSSSSPLSNQFFDSDLSGVEDEEEKLLLKQALLMSLETNIKLQNHLETETHHSFIWQYSIISGDLSLPYDSLHSLYSFPFRFAVYMEIIGEGLQRLVDPLSYTIIIKTGMILAIMVGIVTIMKYFLCSGRIRERSYFRAKVDEKAKRLDNDTVLPSLGLGFKDSGSGIG
ncbi:9195_t:CDS:10 [Ambispora leptoticha]|uniref:9195_t:CDS:1 n=1 Tax=Ambispora leptoticha TaxID=144679 RepID=A0A9N8VY86_9GLOM|nr:9195_t:CDS:10 [Ambispora leptoticha]